MEECLRAMPGVDLDEAYEWVDEHHILPTHRLMIELGSTSYVYTAKKEN